jgi:hypothetical protein
VCESLVRVEIAGALDADAEELDRLAASLREELLELDVRAVDRAPGAPAWHGAKGLPSADVAALVVTVSNSAVAALAVTVWSWASRNRRQKVSIRLGDHEIIVDGASVADARALITSWVELHDRRHS